MAPSRKRKSDSSSTTVDATAGSDKQDKGDKPEKPAVTIEDLLFPRSTINRIAKDALPDSCQISKDALLALQRSTTLFINYILFFANETTGGANRKTLTPEDVLEALSKAEFEGFVPTVKEELSKFEQRKFQKKIQNRQLREAAQEKAAAESNGEPEGENDEGNGVERATEENEENTANNEISGNNESIEAAKESEAEGPKEDNSAVPAGTDRPDSDGGSGDVEMS